MTSATLRIAAWQVLARLPADAQDHLADVAIEEVVAIPHGSALGDAGADDIRIVAMKSAPLAVVMGVLAHELAHVRLGHLARHGAGAITKDDAEAEANALVRRWGFGVELAAAQRWARER